MAIGRVRSIRAMVGGHISPVRVRGHASGSKPPVRQHFVVGAMRGAWYARGHVMKS